MCFSHNRPIKDGFVYVWKLGILQFMTIYGHFSGKNCWKPWHGGTLFSNEFKWSSCPNPEKLKQQEWKCKREWLEDVRNISRHMGPIILKAAEEKHRGWCSSLCVQWGHCGIELAKWSGNQHPGDVLAPNLETGNDSWATIEEICEQLFFGCRRLLLFFWIVVMILFLLSWGN